MKFSTYLINTCLRSHLFLLLKCAHNLDLYLEETRLPRTQELDIINWWKLLNPHRSRLAPKMVEALMCMQAWSRADMLGEGDSKSLWTCLEDDEEMILTSFLFMLTIYNL